MPKKYLVIDRNGAPATVLRSDYLRLKTLDLREFGFTSLTEADLDRQVELVLRSKFKELSAPGKFLENEVLGACD